MQAAGASSITGLPSVVPVSPERRGVGPGVVLDGVERGDTRRHALFNFGLFLVRFHFFSAAVRQ